MQKARFQKRVEGCSFCQSGKTPDFKAVEDLKHYVSERGKIVSRKRTGVCAKHQRRLAREVKKARYLGLLPFAVKI